MPFQSEKQRRYMHANLPDIAKRWERDYAGGGLIPSHEAGIYGLAEGGNIRLQPHTASDLLVQETSTGERPKYQPPGGGATSLGSGRDVGGGGGGPPGGGDPGMTYTAPTVSTTAASEDIGAVDTIASLTKPEVPPGEEGGPGYISPEDLKKLEFKELIDKQNLEKTETWEKEQQWNKPNKFWSFIKNAALVMIPALLPAKLATGWKVGKLGFDYKAGKLDHYLPAKFKSTGELATNITKSVTENAEKMKTRNAELDLYESFADTPNHPERIALQAELEIGKKTPDDVPDRDGVTQETSITIDNIEEVNDAKTQLLRKYQEMNEASRLAWLRQQQQQEDRSKQMASWRMMMQPYMSAQGGRVPQGYNTGGLSNLFRLKNR